MIVNWFRTGFGKLLVVRFWPHYKWCDLVLTTLQVLRYGSDLPMRGAVRFWFLVLVVRFEIGLTKLRRV